MLFKLTLFSLLISLNTIGQSEMSSFTLTGYAKGAKDSSIIYLSSDFEDSNYYKFQSNSCVIIKEKFYFTGKVRGPLGVKFFYQYKDYGIQSSTVFIEKGKLNTRFSIDALRDNIVPIEGSITQQRFQKSFMDIFTKNRFLRDNWYVEINKKYHNYKGEKLDSAISEMRIKYRKLQNNYLDEISEYAIKNSNSIIPIFLMLDNFNGYEEKFVNALRYSSSKIKHSTLYQYVYKKMMDSKSLSIDEKFPILNLVNLHNNKLESLSTYSNKKFIFIDFWFAKCGACVRQFPDFRKIVKSQNDTTFFNLISITIDPEKEINNAINIIAEQKASWVQLWDKDGKNTFALNISSFPTNFLLDCTGKILAKNIEPLELNRFLRTYHK